MLSQSSANTRIVHRITVFRIQRTIMASSARKAVTPSADIQSFSEYLKGCRRILALLGAGTSAASGLPTFRGTGGLWRQYDATALATPEAFENDPGLVWQFYSHRRHMALRAQPNRAHHALAELARRNKDFVTLSQNADGTSRYLIKLLDLMPSHLLRGT